MYYIIQPDVGIFLQIMIKMNACVILTDPIGEFFEAVNLFEYKPPKDVLSIDDFYKAAAYAFIYK